jgi:hypothetical protein
LQHFDNSAAPALDFNTSVDFDGAGPNVAVDIGQLIRPVTVDGGSTYYFWDFNGNGLADNGDKLTHDQLDFIFNAGTDTTDSANTATINGINVALPTIGSGSLMAQTGTPVHLPSDTNSSFDDLTAIWDAFNGADSRTFGEWWDGYFGLPPGWAFDQTQYNDLNRTQAFSYWSATPSTYDDDNNVATPEVPNHVAFNFFFGYANPLHPDTDSYFVALEVQPVI